MHEKEARLVTAEAVRRGHPDKFCDQIADAILDAHLSHDPKARVAVEVMATAGNITIAGEVTSKARVNYEKVALGVIQQIGYKWDDLYEDDDEGHSLKIHVSVHEQSPDIAAAVDGRYPDSDLGAGDQGIVYGYATDETKSMMPRAFVIAQRICQMLDDAARRMPCMGVDGKAQVSLRYEGDRVLVHTIVVSAQHASNAPEDRFRDLVSQIVYQAVGRADMWDANSKLLINPSGRFVYGGPSADTGMTGRKLAVDQYGPIAHIGGGALSGKDATKVDRSGAYAARWIARNLVAARLCRQCEVSIVYAIGVCRPVGLTVNTYGTGVKPDGELARLIWRVFDLRPAGIIERLKLNTPSYSLISVYGHFGRTDLSLPWEQDDMADQLRAAAGHD